MQLQPIPPPTENIIPFGYKYTEVTENFVKANHIFFIHYFVNNFNINWMDSLYMLLPYIITGEYKADCFLTEILSNQDGIVI